MALFISKISGDKMLEPDIRVPVGFYEFMMEKFDWVLSKKSGERY